MTNINSMLKSRDTILPRKDCTIEAMVFPVVMYGCESWTIKKAESQRIDAFKLWCWRRLLRVPGTAQRSNQSILKGINPEYSLEGLMLEPPGPPSQDTQKLKTHGISFPNRKSPQMLVKVKHLSDTEVGWISNPIPLDICPLVVEEMWTQTLTEGCTERRTPCDESHRDWMMYL